jgi:hypothetical protein
MVPEVLHEFHEVEVKVDPLRALDLVQDLHLHPRFERLKKAEKTEAGDQRGLPL